MLVRQIQAVAGVFARPVCDLCRDIGRFSAAEKSGDVVTARLDVISTGKAFEDSIAEQLARGKEETPEQAPQACRVAVVQLLQWQGLPCFWHDCSVQC